MAYIAHAYGMKHTSLCKDTKWNGKSVIIKPEEEY